MLAERIREVPIGSVVSVLADDPAARTDLPAWCGLKSHEFVLETALPTRVVVPGPPLLLNLSSAPGSAAYPGLGRADGEVH